jgi:hypothetical protein
MKKLLTVSFLTLGIFLISGCSLTEQKSVDNSATTEQITALQEQMSGFSSQEENNLLKRENEKIKENEIQKVENTNNINNADNSSNYNENNDEWFEWWWSDPQYKNKIQSYKSWYIGIDIWWQGWMEVALYYEKDWKIIKREWWIFVYIDKLYYGSMDCYAGNDNTVEGGCKIVKDFDLKSCDKTDNRCSEWISKYVSDLINWKKHNDYFSEKINWFKEWL